MGKYVKQSVDWIAVRDTINKKLDKNYSTSYIQAVHKGHQTNKGISEILERLLG